MHDPLNKTRTCDNRITMALREVVVDHHFVTIANQLFTDTSDVSGAAG